MYAGRLFVLFVIPLCFSACTDASRTRVDRSSELAALNPKPRTGSFVGDDMVSRWNSQIVYGKVSAVIEHVALSGGLVGDRRYEFDSIGGLRLFVERVSRMQRASLNDTLPPADARVSEIEFVSGMPVLYTRRFRDTHFRYDPKEIRRIVNHANALFDSAIARR